ncbi:ArsC/Spx/MgsR family protein [Sphingomonas lenta]|uniref:Arsenate reductase (Glutaredoxin) n=1 Tax=Sphingomonas lenta TaxID=1141887 RepID=A0A2A2SBM6_9SPHN|nr:ArsC/Spx/MgsR family protein [Sphingomonas lenta]PAX06704.1 arsenate reductase (glutaredoxin) [Sphingomonas lenta]
MKATILHNLRCSKSRAALALLQEAGAAVIVVDYLADPPNRAELARLLGRAGLRPRDALRPEAKDVVPTDADDAAVLDAMVADPRLIERPLVETARGVRLCRPPERVRDLLPPR